MKLLLYLLLAPLPSLIWLAFYLRKDRHPEPNRMVIKIFLLGVLMVPLAGFLEYGAGFLIDRLSLVNKIAILVISFAFIEEILKYAVVKFGVLKNPEFDEPVDSMIYLIIAALGFAAAENIWLLSRALPGDIQIGPAVEFITARFLGATFLHALASAIVGYFLAASLLISSKIRKIFVTGGLIGATILHSVFNYIIILSDQGKITVSERNFYLVILLLGMAIIVSWMFKRVNKYRSTCKI